MLSQLSSKKSNLLPLVPPGLEIRNFLETFRGESGRYRRGDTAARVVETDDVVRFDMALGSLVATGMRVALDEDKVELRSNIRGQFIP